MKKTKIPIPAAMNFSSIAQIDVPQGRTGKHHIVVARIISDLQQLDPGRALKIPLKSLADSKENVRSALNRATRAKGISVATASDDEFLYVWTSEAVTK